MRIMITNDDGYAARGIRVLTAAIARWAEQSSSSSPHEVIVLAPNTNFSGAAAAVGEVYSRTGIDYQRVELDMAPQVEAYALDASPALCTMVGCLGGLGPRPDLIVSGINHGVNVGRSVLYSGTVGAVLSGGQMGASGLAVSMRSRKGAPLEVAASIAVSLLDDLLEAPPSTLLNLNVPSIEFTELKGIRRGRISQAGIVKQTSSVFGASKGEPLAVGEKATLSITLGTAVPSLGDVSDEEPDDDGALIAAGYASLTSLRGVHEDASASADDLLRTLVSSAEAHLHAQLP